MLNIRQIVKRTKPKQDTGVGSEYNVTLGLTTPFLDHPHWPSTPTKGERQEH